MIHADEFYQTHKDCDWKLPNIPSNIINDIDKVKWIFEQKIGWIELDLNIDVLEWQQEAKEAEAFLVEHREGGGHQGWRSCCIHGLDVDKTGVWNLYQDSDSGYHWTRLSNLTPTITTFWKQFPFEDLVRVRFMEVAPGGWVAPHNDTPPGAKVDLMEHIIPINIAIDHPDNCQMTLKDFGCVPWKNGKVILVNITNDHSVYNYSDHPRMHMIGHGHIGNKIEEFCKLIIRSYNKQYERNSI
jgi:hypothetical protein